MPAQHTNEAGSVDRSTVELQLTRVLSSPNFANAGRLAAFLQYIITKSLAGEAEQIKEYTIGVEVCGRLERYYYGQGREDPIHIEVPRGRYVPVLRRMETRKPVAWKNWHTTAAWIGLLAIAALSGFGRLPLRAEEFHIAT